MHILYYCLYGSANFTTVTPLSCYESVSVVFLVISNTSSSLCPSWTIFYVSVRPQLSAELSVWLISQLRNAFRPCFKVLQTDLHLLYTSIWSWRQLNNQRRRYSPPNLDGQASIIGQVKPFCLSTLICSKLPLLVNSTETSRCDYPLPITTNSFLCSITEIQWERATNNHYRIVCNTFYDW